MTSWIVAIDKDYPQQWRIAQAHRFWDLTRNARIEAGDDVYCWLSGTGLVGSTEATKDTRPLRPGEPLPWEDEGVRKYAYHFALRVRSARPIGQRTWSQLQAATGVTAYPNIGPLRVDSRPGQAWLAQRFRR